MPGLLGLTGLYVLLGVLAAAAVICAAFCCCCQDDDGEKGGAGASASSAAEKRQALLNKTDVSVSVPSPPQQEKGGGGDVEACAICGARLGDAEWGQCRRLRPCGHVYHADCVDLWLARKSICPVCRAAVVGTRTELVHAMV